jgi:hypothetical protein
LATAVSADLADQKSSFSIDDVLELGEDEAVGFAAKGQFQVAVNANWSDLLATGLSRLTQLILSDEPVAIHLPAKASIKLTLGVEDGFKLVFLGLPDQKIRVALRASQEGSFKASIKSGIVVKISNPGDIIGILDNVVSGLLGFSPDAFRKAVAGLKQRSRINELSSIERDLLESLAERLGLDASIRTVKAGLNRLQEF